MSAEEVFGTYKKRWGIETFYKYLKNVGGFNNLMFQDYYKEQGFAFIMLIVGQIHNAMMNGLKKNQFEVLDRVADAIDVKGKISPYDADVKREMEYAALSYCDGTYCSIEDAYEGFIQNVYTMYPELYNDCFII